jgi:hypothetical protein
LVTPPGNYEEQGVLLVELVFKRDWIWRISGNERLEVRGRGVLHGIAQEHAQIHPVTVLSHFTALGVAQVHVDDAPNSLWKVSVPTPTPVGIFSWRKVICFWNKKVGLHSYCSSEDLTEGGLLDKALRSTCRTWLLLRLRFINEVRPAFVRPGQMRKPLGGRCLQVTHYLEVCVTAAPELDAQVEEDLGS